MLTKLVRGIVNRLPGTLPLRVKDRINRIRLPEYRDWRQFEERILRQLKAPQFVLHGPFEGMPYVSLAFHSRRVPKLLGTYEMELHPTLRAMASRDIELVVDIGAAEGYYATGLARLLPGVRVVAFEAERPARALLREMLAMSGVSARVVVRGLCDLEALDRTLGTGLGALVFSDCEGAEDTLLDPDAVPGLRHAMLIVETHDRKVLGVTDRLIGRFEATHDIERIPTRERTLEDLPAGLPLSEADALEAMAERSHPQEFLVMRPRASTGAGPG